MMIDSESEKHYIDGLFEDNVNKTVANVTNNCRYSHGMLDSIKNYFKLNENSVITRDLIDRLEDNNEPIAWNKTAKAFYGLD